MGKGGIVPYVYFAADRVCEQSVQGYEPNSQGLGAKHEAEGVLKVLPDFEPGLTDIEGFSHLIVMWEFDRSAGFELLGTPPSDNRPHGVFATRSPRRPILLGPTAVELLRRDGAELHVRGVDMLDGTPILDIKPYLSSVPAESCAADGSPKLKHERNDAFCSSSPNFAFSRGWSSRATLGCTARRAAQVDPSITLRAESPCLTGRRQQRKVELCC